MSDIQPQDFQTDDKHINNINNLEENNLEEENKEFKCIYCNTISYKTLMCHCNDNKAIEYMDNNPNSKLSLNLVKCYNCNNCWHGYKRCECDSENESENESEYNKHYFDDFIKCTNCGNIWDGFAQCNCWRYSDIYNCEDETIECSEPIECSETNDTCINNKDDN